MQTIQGKYNSANVMIDEIDEETRNQIYQFLNCPAFAGTYIAIMPDCHAGAGSCIGFTMPMNQYIIPNVVGVDIGCGMLSYKFDIDHLDLPALDQFIKENIPSGFSISNKPYRGKDFFSKTAKKIDMDQTRVFNSIGTLGGGNHFIEAGYGNDQKLWLTVHTGSRNFGLKIAKYHSDIAKALCLKWNAATNGIPYLLVDSPEGQDYIADQLIGSEYARINRIEIMKKLSAFLRKTPLDQIESKHNFIDPEGMIRKGATPAHKGERVIIPFNMRDGLAICEGLGSKKYNNSAPHGAGRIYSRSKAKELLDVELFQEEMKSAGIFTTTAGKETLDEAPGAYKETSVILQNISETVKVLEMVKPIYNFKASE